MKTDTLLFQKEEVKKFFIILDELSGAIPVNTFNYPWKDYQTIYTKGSNHIPSTREVFVHRTLYKWLKGKYLIIYRTSDLGITYRQYVMISSLAYFNDWSSTGYIGVNLFDFGNPASGVSFAKEKFNYSTAISLEGEWVTDVSNHISLMNMMLMEDIPKKEYVFKAYDFYKYNKKTKSFYETTISVKARTIAEAYKEKEKFEQKCKETNSNLVLTSEIIEIKEL